MLRARHAVRPSAPSTSDSHSLRKPSTSRPRGRPAGSAKSGATAARERVELARRVGAPRETGLARVRLLELVERRRTAGGRGRLGSQGGEGGHASATVGSRPARPRPPPRRRARAGRVPRGRALVARSYADLVLEALAVAAARRRAATTCRRRPAPNSSVTGATPAPRRCRTARGCPAPRPKNSSACSRENGRRWRNGASDRRSPSGSAGSPNSGSPRPRRASMRRRFSAPGRR